MTSTDPVDPVQYQKLDIVEDKKKNKEQQPITIAEIIILLPNLLDDNLLTKFPFMEEFKFKRTLHIACPITNKISDLKRRLSGLTGIPVDFIRFIFCGNILQDDEIIPIDAFSSLHDNLQAQEDIFRPHIYFNIYHHVDKNHDDKSQEEKEEIADVKIENLEDSQLQNDKNNTDDKLIEDNILLNQLQQRELELEKIFNNYLNTKNEVFDLKSDLMKISCSRYFDALNNSGYNEEGAFAYLTDSILRGSDLWLPRHARVRVLALAETVRRRYEILEHETEGNARTQVERDMILSSASNANNLNIDGQEQYYLKKKDVIKAWEEKVDRDAQLQLLLKKEELDKSQKMELEIQQDKSLNNLKLKLKNPVNEYESYCQYVDTLSSRKEHSRETKNKINQIRRKCAQDDLEINICPLIKNTKGDVNSYNSNDGNNSFQWCCVRHQLESQKFREESIKKKKLLNIADLESYLYTSDPYKNGFVSRDILKVILLKQLKHCRHSLDEVDVEVLLDECAMPLEEQIQRLSWTVSTFGTTSKSHLCLPSRAYSPSVFVRKVVDVLESMDRARLIG